MRIERRRSLGFICAAALMAGVAGIAREQAWVNSIGMKMIRIPAGEFTQGSPSSEPGHEADERQRPVTVGKPFFMAATEVTQSQWNALMERNPSRVSGENRPVESVTWKDAQEFLRRLSEKEGKIYRLPTESEWEYACRAGTSGPFSVSASKIEEAALTAPEKPVALDIERMYKPEAAGRAEMFEGAPEEVADKLVEVLAKAGAI